VVVAHHGRRRGLSHSRAARLADTMYDDPAARRSQLAGVLVIETFNELNKSRLRHKPAPTYLDAAELSCADQLECGGTSDAKTFHHFFDRVQSGGRPARGCLHAILLCLFDTILIVDVSYRYSYIDARIRTSAR
jgi:hypothetical protein